jgi:hypothetical protein
MNSIFAKNANVFGTYSLETGVNTGVSQYLYYFIVLTIFILLLLTLVHFTITPIFKTAPGAQGYIPMPGSDDAALYWKKETELTILKDTETVLGTNTQNYSMMLDVQVDNPTANTNFPRVLFTRGALLTLPAQYTDRDTILSLVNSFNLILYLDRLTNDLNITIQTQTLNGTITLETIPIPNIPVGKGVRIGVMVGSKVLEVYVNGYLVKSKAFANSIRAVSGQIQPPSDTILSATARVRNLRLWNRPLSPSEFRSYGGAEDFGRKPFPDSCVA